MTAVAAALKTSQPSMLWRLRPLLALVRPQRGLLAFAVLSGMVHHLVMMAVAATSAWLVGSAITGAPVDDLRPGLVLLVCLLVPLAVTPWLESHLAHIAAFRILVDVRRDVYAAFERLAPGYLIERRSGDLSSSAISDVEALELYFAHTLSPLIVAVTAPLAALVTLVVVHPALALALTPVLALLGSVPLWLRRRAQAQGVELRQRLGEVSAETVETFQGLRELVTFGAGQRQSARLAGQESRLQDAKVAHGRQEHLRAPAAAVVGRHRGWHHSRRARRAGLPAG